jgi:hypothetical protein
MNLLRSRDQIIRQFMESETEFTSTRRPFTVSAESKSVTGSPLRKTTAEQKKGAKRDETNTKPALLRNCLA